MNKNTLKSALAIYQLCRKASGWLFLLFFIFAIVGGILKLINAYPLSISYKQILWYFLYVFIAINIVGAIASFVAEKSILKK